VPYSRAHHRIKISYLPHYLLLNLQSANLQRLHISAGIAASFQVGHYSQHTDCLSYHWGKLEHSKHLFRSLSHHSFHHSISFQFTTQRYRPDGPPKNKKLSSLSSPEGHASKKKITHRNSPSTSAPLCPVTEQKASCSHISAVTASIRKSLFIVRQPLQENASLKTFGSSKRSKERLAGLRPLHC
jgi:hypothetical protein